MSPYRKARNWRILIGGLCASLIIATAFIATSLALWQRGEHLDDQFYEQCVIDEVQDAVIVAQLEAAKRRARASLPPRSAELFYQLEVLEDGIAALEPPDEPECNLPEGTEP